MNYVFIGMPGSGKSTIARMFAEKKGLSFLDTDKIIEANYGGKPLQTILDEIGNNVFKQVEEDTLCALDCDNAAIATGGSAVYSEKGMAHLKEICKIVYLDVDYDILVKRIVNPTSRGIVLAPGETLLDLYNRRTPLYEKYADIVLKSGTESPQITVINLIKKIKKEGF